MQCWVRSSTKVIISIKKKVLKLYSSVLTTVLTNLSDRLVIKCVTVLVHSERCVEILLVRFGSIAQMQYLNIWLKIALNIPLCIITRW